VKEASEASPPEGSAYRAAGVDIDEGRRAVDRIRRHVQTTYTPRVVGQLGAFAGLFAYPEPDSERLLVASMDGVGTKLKIAAQLGRWHGVGYDIVSHCVNDILVQGATPLFFLDYVGTGKLSAETVEELVSGMSQACREAGCALIGGETAEMPGMYPPGELDLVGTIVGEVARKDLIDGRTIGPGHRLLGLTSVGLHTNGYSLARRIFGLDQSPEALDLPIEGESETLGALLLRPHRMYLPLVRGLLGSGVVDGMAHITGGGIPDNLPRILPEGVRAVVRRDSWVVPPLFRSLREAGRLDQDESYRVFNMGIGFILAVRPENLDVVTRHLTEAGESPVELGWCEAGPASVRWAGGGEAPLS
jgi:phosphoribosylformylglycinamidine cyclo-ligase